MRISLRWVVSGPAKHACVSLPVYSVCRTCAEIRASQILQCRKVRVSWFLVLAIRVSVTVSQIRVRQIRVSHFHVL